MEKTYLKKIISGAISAVFAIATISFAPVASATLSLDAEGASLYFPNDNYIDLAVGESHLYENVATLEGQSIDARITVDSVSDGTDLEDVDESNSDGVDSYLFVGCGDGCDPYDEDFTPADGFKGYVQYTIDFFEAGTQTPVTLRNFSFYVRDIDTYQYIEVLEPHGYILDEETNISVLYNEDNSDIAVGNVRFQETQGIDSDSDEQDHWVEIKFTSLSSLTYSIGQDIPSGAFFSVRFYPVTFDNPVEHETIFVPPVTKKLKRTVFFSGDSAYLQPKWFKMLDKLIAKVPTCATNVTATIFSGVKKAKSEVKGSELAQRRAAIVKKFLAKRGLVASIQLQPNGKGTKALNKKRYAKVVVNYTDCAQ